MFNLENRWIPEIQLYSPSCPLIIVACKSDLKLSELNCVPDELAKSVALKYGIKFYECSSLNPSSIHSLFENLLVDLDGNMRKTDIVEFVNHLPTLSLLRTSKSMKLDDSIDLLAEDSINSTVARANDVPKKDEIINTYDAVDSNLAQVQEQVSDNDPPNLKISHGSGITAVEEENVSSFPNMQESGMLSNQLNHGRSSNDLSNISSKGQKYLVRLFSKSKKKGDDAMMRCKTVGITMHKEETGMIRSKTVSTLNLKYQNLGIDGRSSPNHSNLSQATFSNSQDVLPRKMKTFWKKIGF
jgi:hypothetical protein